MLHFIWVEIAKQDIGFKLNLGEDAVLVGYAIANPPDEIYSNLSKVDLIREFKRFLKSRHPEKNQLQLYDDQTLDNRSEMNLSDRREGHILVSN